MENTLLFNETVDENGNVVFLPRNELAGLMCRRSKGLDEVSFKELYYELRNTKFKIQVVYAE